MTDILAYIIAFTIFSGFVGLSGGLILLRKEKISRKISIYFVSFAAGTLLGAVFLEFFPEMISIGITEAHFAYVLAGIVAFFFIEHLLQWHHHHHGKERHTLSSMVILGDSIHNFIDGMVIAAAFIVNIPLGVITSIAVLFHEIPQEVGDFGVLLHAGMSKSKIILYNMLSALIALVGALTIYLWASLSVILNSTNLLAFTAGIFIYIAGVDLMPEIKKEKKSIAAVHVIMLIAGILLIWLVGKIFPGS